MHISCTQLHLAGLGYFEFFHSIFGGEDKNMVSFLSRHTFYHIVQKETRLNPKYLLFIGYQRHTTSQLFGENAKNLQGKGTMVEAKKIWSVVSTMVPYNFTFFLEPCTFHVHNFI